MWGLGVVPAESFIIIALCFWLLVFCIDQSNENKTNTEIQWRLSGGVGWGGGGSLSNLMTSLAGSECPHGHLVYGKDMERGSGEKSMFEEVELI